MSGFLWTQHRRPESGTDMPVWLREPSDASQLTAQRRALGTALQDGDLPGRTRPDGVERLLLAFEELVSNALRHGRRPVQVSVTTTGSGWLLDVSDAATGRPPAPAVGRDAAEGGMGLYLVARISSEHGWELDGDRKHVWAYVCFGAAEAPPQPVESPARPRPAPC